MSPVAVLRVFNTMKLESEPTEEELYPNHDILTLFFQWGDNYENEDLEYAFLRSDGWVRAKTSSGIPVKYAPANIIRIHPKNP